MAHFDLPLRNRKDLARAAQLRNFAMAGRPFNSRAAIPVNYEDSYLPISRRRPDRSLSNPYYAPSLASYTSDQGSDARFSDIYDYRPASYPRRTGGEYSSNTRLPFTKAARALHRALNTAWRGAAQLEQDFDAEMQRLPYVDERTRAHLWTLKVEYRGWSADVDAPPDTNPQVDFFAKQAGNLLDAIDDMREAEYPSSHEWSEQRGGHGHGHDAVAMEDVRLAMKKLGVSFGAVAELLEGMKVDRQRCGVLVRELGSALGIMQSIKESWEMPRNGKGAFRGNAGAAAAADGRIPVSEAFTGWSDICTETI